MAIESSFPEIIYLTHEGSNELTHLNKYGIMSCPLLQREIKPVRLYYLDESENPKHFVRSAIGINAEDWNQVFALIRDWRKDVMRRYHIPLFKELHASDLLALRGNLVREGSKYRRIKRMEDAVDIFITGLQRLENIATSLSGGLEIINVSLPKVPGRIREIDTLDRILNRIQTSVKTDGRRAFLIFDEGKEKKINYYFRRMRVYNPIPSMFGHWETGEQWKNIPISHIIGGPAFRNSAGDYFIQLVDFVAYALLKQDEQPPISRIAAYNIHEAFKILDAALNKEASKDDAQGVVRK